MTLQEIILSPTGAYAPTAPSWFYQATIPTDFYSSYISGAQKMPNGNVLICEGANGHFFEVDFNANKHWDYISPVSSNGPIAQGGNPNLNDVFRVYRYPANYPGFNGLTLIPGNPIELNPLPSNCVIFTGTEIINYYENNVIIFSALFSHQISIINKFDYKINIHFYDIEGRVLGQASVLAKSETTHSINKNSGLIICKITNQKNKLLTVKKLIIHE